jgi:hypothetical protein
VKDETRKRLKWAVATCIVFIGVGLVVLRALLGFETVLGESEPVASEQVWDTLDEVLAGSVGADGLVDYTSLAESRDALGSVAAALAEWGPRSAPDQFGTDDAKLAYYINAYNVLTLLGVVSHWPITSVHDVHGRLNPKDGFGFFYGLRFQLDGERLNLYKLENSVMRARFVDARFHAAINCASGACPRLRAEAYRRAELQTQLAEAAEEFASEAPHMEIDTEARVIRLSMIYSWYAGDFEAHAGAQGHGDGVLDWVHAHASAPVADELAAARTQGFSVEYTAYDWSLNGY